MRHASSISPQAAPLVDEVVGSAVSDEVDASDVDVSSVVSWLVSPESSAVELEDVDVDDDPVLLLEVTSPLELVDAGPPVDPV